ncbi:MAG: hypothetical protein EX269_02635 [Acidimicrobiales bacterium]|nr:MAG: hypothetical protein EX269_02635 [Acidimicrobiales bacterium]
MADEHIDDMMNRVGREPVQPVDGAFANRLETDLRTQSQQGVAPLRQPAWWLRPSTVVAFGLLIVLVGLAVGILRSDPATIEITTAQGSSISVPGSDEIVEGQAGMELEDGTRIEVGSGGSITVGGVVLDEGSTAVVEAGSLDVIGPSSLSTTTTTQEPAPDDTAETTRPTPKTGTVVEQTTAPPTTTDDSLPTTVAPETTVPRTTIPRTTVPKTTLPPEIKPTTTQPASLLTAAPETTVPETRPQTTVPARIKIDAELVDLGDRVGTLTWRVGETDAAIAGWIIQVRRGDGIANLATMRQPEARLLRVEITNENLEFRVVARGEDGVLGESAWIAPSS